MRNILASFFFWIIRSKSDTKLKETGRKKKLYIPVDVNSLIVLIEIRTFLEKSSSPTQEKKTEILAGGTGGV